MDAGVINFKPYAKSHLNRFSDLAVGGLVVTGCKVFAERHQLWFGWPSGKIQGRTGMVEYRDNVAASGPMMKHLQGAFSAQLWLLLEHSGPLSHEVGRQPP
jgi:hypothetical protein